MEGKTDGAVVTSGQTRLYLLYVPKPTTDPSRWNDLADEHGFLIVCPSGSGFPRVWPRYPDSLEPDVGFISDLIDKLEADYNIDPTPIYADECRSVGRPSRAQT
jgi:hypothetical protein